MPTSPAEVSPNDPLETGRLRVLVRPVVNVDAIERLVDVQSLHLVLEPEDGAARLLEVGRKRLPAIDEDVQNWGHVVATGAPDEITERLAAETYETSTRGTQEQGGPRELGVGTYRLVRAGRDTQLHADLEIAVDATRGDLVDAVHLHPAASYVLTVKNPLARTDEGVGLTDEERVEFPEELQAVFDGNRWAPADPPALLDHVGAEFLLIGIARD